MELHRCFDSLTTKLGVLQCVKIVFYRLLVASINLQVKTAVCLACLWQFVVSENGHFSWEKKKGG